MSEVIGLIPASGAELQVYDSDNSKWVTLPGASGFTSSGGEASETDIETFAGSGKITGVPSVASVSINVAAHIPYTSLANKLATNQGQDLHSFRVRTKARVVSKKVTGKQVAIATDGSVTFSGTGQSGGKVDNATTFPNKVVLQLDTGTPKKFFVIDSIAEDGAMTVEEAPASAVTAQEYELKVPALKRDFQATVRAFGNDTLDAGSALQTTLELTPQGDLPNWEVIPEIDSA